MPFQPLMNRLQTFSSHEDIDILGEPAKAMLEQGHAARNRVRNPQVGEPAGDLEQSILDGALLLEVSAPSLKAHPQSWFRRCS